MEFLNIKVGQHEKLIGSLEEKVKQLEEENKSNEYRSQYEIETLKSTSQNEIETLTNQCSKYKAELTELTAFAAVKVILFHSKSSRLIWRKKLYCMRN